MCFVLHLGPQTRFFGSFQVSNGSQICIEDGLHIFCYIPLPWCSFFCYMHKTNMWFLFFFYFYILWRENYFLWALRRQPLSVELIAQTVIVVCRKKTYGASQESEVRKRRRILIVIFPKSIYLGLIINSWICGYFFCCYFLHLNLILLVLGIFFAAAPTLWEEKINFAFKALSRRKILTVVMWKIPLNISRKLIISTCVNI